MKVSGFLVMFFVIWTALMLFTLSGVKYGCKIHDMSLTHNGDGSAVTIGNNRKLKESNNNHNKPKPSTKEKRSLGTVNLEDYHPVDPVPSSKASVKPGPIEHGAPIIPYIPRPCPPDPPGSG